MECFSSDGLEDISLYLTEHDNAGTFAVRGMNKSRIDELAKKLELPIVYICRNDKYTPDRMIPYGGRLYRDSDIDIELGYNFPRFYSRSATKGCRFCFDYFGSSYMLARLLDSDSPFKQYCVILLDESMLGRQFTTESGERVAFFSLDNEGSNEIFGGLQVVFKASENKAIVSGSQIRTIATSLKLTKIENSQFSYNYQHIFYKDVECVFERSQALHLTRILMEKSGQALKHTELRVELSKCSQPVHISAKGIKDGVMLNSRYLSNRLSTMKSQANQAIRKAIIKSGTSKNVNTLDFVAYAGKNKGYRFNNQGY